MLKKGSAVVPEMTEISAINADFQSSVAKIIDYCMYKTISNASLKNSLECISKELSRMHI